MRTFLVFSFAAVPALAQNDSGPEAVKPVITWTFDKPEPGFAKPADDHGPRPPTYPGFNEKNLAQRFNGKGLTIRERDVPDVNLRFQQGESITLEAWVNAAKLADGAYSYIMGKGRTQAGAVNQNYALRLHGAKGQAQITFLFASAADAKAKSEWHRWTSSAGFTVDGAWHHIAVSYTFGEPKSIHGYIDGKFVTGAWDMAGATTRPPTEDADDFQIATGNGGGTNNTFTGLLDNVSVWRTIIPESVLIARYQRVAEAPAVDSKSLPAGKVLVQLCTKGVPEKNSWPDANPPADEFYHEDCFGFFDMPQYHDHDGVRGQRPNPLLLRAAANVTFPLGPQRILLRGRGAARLFIDGKLILSTPFPPSDTSGHGHVREASSYLNLGPDFRFAPPGNRESTVTVNVASGPHVVLLETIVGGVLGKNNRRRPELGETVAAIATGKGDAWSLISPGRAVPYTDAGWAAYAMEREKHYDAIDTQARAAKRAEHEAYWAKRRAAADAWLKSTPEVPVPPLSDGAPAFNTIDYFLAKVIDDAKVQNAAAAKSPVNYFKQIQPLLEAKCYGCHVGENAKGGLRLDDRTSTFKGGDSGSTITPQHVEKSELLARVKATDAAERMPPKGDALTADEIALIEKWIAAGATWPALDARHTTFTPLCDDRTFLRRAHLDTLGLLPTPAEIDAFEKDTSTDKREKLIDRLLADPRGADHAISDWLDALAENPNILNPTLNNTGPFRWWLLDALRDNLPADRFATQLLRMQGSERFGGPAGFAVASQNDAPLAAKGTIIAAAFLGVEMKCARCHDAPSHRSKQEDLFHLAAMLAGKPVTLPATSTVPLDKIHDGGRKPLISVTLKPGTAVAAQWPFERFSPASAASLAENPADTRDALAALVTAPQNERFAQVMVNRLWARLMGRGLVEPLDDWEKGKPSHPELLRWLGRELVRHQYDLKAVAKLIMTSHAYQRAADATLRETPVLFTAPAKLRLPAEVIVDSLFATTGVPFDLGEVSLDVDGIREQNQSLSLGVPRRSWMLTSTSNERDRPSLSLPRISVVTDVLAAYGWRGARQDPASRRDHDPNVLQPAILSNSTLGLWITRATDDHAFTAIALQAKSPEQIVEELFPRALTRKPTEAERRALVDYLRPGFESRLRTAEALSKPPHRPLPYVSWSNHLDPKANELKLEEEARLRAGPTPTTRLDAEWRQRLENVTWAVLNSPEFIHRP
jgi:mono/diheme cytochrome c family protein